MGAVAAEARRGSMASRNGRAMPTPPAPRRNVRRSSTVLRMLVVSFPSLGDPVTEAGQRDELDEHVVEAAVRPEVRRDRVEGRCLRVGDLATQVEARELSGQTVLERGRGQ